MSDTRFEISDDFMEGVCPKCFTAFERPEHVPLDHPGTFCPVCRDRGLTLIGIVSFTPDIRLNMLPLGVTTA